MNTAAAKPAQEYRTVKVIIDRPLGSYHPEHKDTYYSINYGYFEDITAQNGGRTLRLRYGSKRTERSIYMKSNCYYTEKG